MAHAFLLTDWITLKTALGGTVTQGVDDYADLLNYQDVTVYLEVAEATTASIEYQTSPTKDDVFFTNMVAAVTPAVGVTPTVIRFETATMPLSRYMRWRVSPTLGTGMSITFRIWISPNPS